MGKAARVQVLAALAVAGAVAVGGCGGPFMSDDSTEASGSAAGAAAKQGDAAKHGDGTTKHDEAIDGDRME